MKLSPSNNKHYKPWVIGYAAMAQSIAEYDKESAQRYLEIVHGVGYSVEFNKKQRRANSILNNQWRRKS